MKIRSIISGLRFSKRFLDSPKVLRLPLKYPNMTPVSNKIGVYGKVFLFDISRRMVPKINEHMMNSKIESP